MQSVSVLPLRLGHYCTEGGFRVEAGGNGRALCVANLDPGATREVKRKMWFHQMSLKGMLMWDRVSAEERREMK